MEALAEADLLVIFTRFLNLPDEQMTLLDAYLEKGGPVVGMRTSSHAFKIPANRKYATYDYRSKVKGYENGFGHQVLGNIWVGHYEGMDGEKHRVFHSTQGASLDLLDQNYRRMLINGIFWAIGAESAIKPDLKVSFVGPRSSPAGPRWSP